MIKVCPDPQCEAVYHNCEVTDKYCIDCGHRIMRINIETFLKKFKNNWFQYDFQTGEYYRPDLNKSNQLQLF